MTEPSPRKTTSSWLGPTLVWGGVAAGAIALGLLAKPPGFPGGVSPGRLLPRMPGPPSDFRVLLYQLGVGSFVWNAAAVALPFLLWGVRRADVDRYGWRRVLLVSAAVVLAVMLVSGVVEYALMYRGMPSRPPLKAYWPFALRQNILPWVALVGIVIGVEARRRSVRAAVERERLRAQIAEQRLVTLTAQLHPHFLFNTLQGISTLIHRDPEAADEMLAKLSDLLRDLLRHRDRALVPLEDEIRYARTFLEIARLRFADRLEFDIDVAADVEQPSVPLFILQPLVENALSHGIGGRARGGRVSLKVWRDNGRLLLQVADDGAGLPSGGVPREGIGLSNTRERLRASFGGDQTFSLTGNGAGAVARIDIPYRDAR